MKLLKGSNTTAKLRAARVTTHGLVGLSTRLSGNPTRCGRNCSAVNGRLRDLVTRQWRGKCRGAGHLPGTKSVGRRESEATRRYRRGYPISDIPHSHSLPQETLRPLGSAEFLSPLPRGGRKPCQVLSPIRPKQAATDLETGATPSRAHASLGHGRNTTTTSACTELRWYAPCSSGSRAPTPRAQRGG